MIKRVFKYTALAFVLLPVLYLFFLNIKADILFLETDLFYKLLSNDKLLNSFVLAMVVGFIGTFLAFCISLLYYHIYKRQVRYLFGISLLFLFFVAPIIYASLFSQIESFQHLSAFIRSVIVLLVWLSPLGSGIVIVRMYYIDQYSLEMLRFISVKKLYVLRELVFKQIAPTLAGVFVLIFLMVFIQEEVPSFFGYRTYAEEFLSRIVLQEEFESTLFFALPFIFLSFLAFVIFYTFLRQKRSIWREDIYPLESLGLIKDKKILYSMIGMIFLFILFCLYLLVANMDFSLFMNSFEENIYVMFHSLFLAASASAFVTLLSLYFVSIFQKQQTLLVLICITSLYWLLPSSLNALVLLQFSQYFYIESELYAYFLLIYAYILRVLPIGLIVAVILQRRVVQNPLRFVTISKYKEFMKITLPKNYKSWFVIFVLEFFLVLNEITTTVLLVPPGFETIIVKIYNLLHYGDLSQIVFLSLMQIFIVILGLALFAFIKGMNDKA